MQRILITGGAGFLASSLADALLLTQQYELVLVDNLITGDIRKLPNHVNSKFIKCDVNDYDDIAAIMTAYRFDYVFHYAALVGVKRTLDNPVSVLKDIQGIQNMLNLSKNTGVKRFFFTSSSEVYGEPVELPQNEETTPLNSRLPYAVVKNVGEAYCRSYQKEFGLDFTIFRFFNTYGPKQSPDFVISRFLKAALKSEPLFVYGTGNQSRTFCHVDDNVDTIITCLTEGSFINDVLNIGSVKDFTITELAKKVIAVTRSKSAIEFLPPLKEGDMTRRQPDNTKMKQLLKRDLIGLEEGLFRIQNDEIFLKLNSI